MTSRYFTAFCLRSANPIAVSRFGFTVPRALGNAVERNRIKRRMREAVRNQFGAIPTSWDVVFNPRRNVLDASFEELCREIGRIFMQCKQL